MPGIRKIIPTKNGPKEGVVIAVNSSQEHFNVYMLEDGTVLKTKNVVADVVRVDGEYDDEGNPSYYLKSMMIVTAEAPPNLKRKSQP